MVVDRRAGGVGRLAESIPPSAQKVLATLGALPAIEDAGFVRWTGNTVWWAGEEARVEAFAPGIAGYQVERHAFDQRLRALAVESGARILTGVVRRVVPGEQPTADVETDEGETRIEARFVLDCSGRAGVIARQGLRLAGDAPGTVAIAAVWRDDEGWHGCEPGHTLVASYEDGWSWSVPTAAATRHFTVMVDPARTGLARGAAPRDIYLKELAKVRPFQPLLSRATLTKGPWGADASVYHAKTYAGPGFLIVGDAASSIDPLSSFGVKKALASGWLAAVAVHTAVTQPDRQALAFEFFDRRERELFAAAVRQSAAFAAEAADRNAHPFWLSRAAVSESLDEGGGAGAEALVRDPAVRATFEDLRRRPSLAVERGERAGVEPRAAVRGREIVLDDHLVLPDWPHGLRHVKNVDLVALYRLAPRHTDVGELFDAFVIDHPHVELPDFLGALSLLIAVGALQLR